MNCTICGREIPKVWPDGPETQLEGSLEIKFIGYYGGFFDFVEAIAGTPFPTAHICNGCASELCEREPWITELINKQ